MRVRSGWPWEFRRRGPQALARYCQWLCNKIKVDILRAGNAGRSHERPIRALGGRGEAVGDQAERSPIEPLTIFGRWRFPIMQMFGWKQNDAFRPWLDEGYATASVLSLQWSIIIAHYSITRYSASYVTHHKASVNSLKDILPLRFVSYILNVIVNFCSAVPWKKASIQLQNTGTWKGHYCEVMWWWGDEVIGDEVMRWWGDEVMRWWGDVVRYTHGLTSPCLLSLLSFVAIFENRKLTIICFVFSVLELFQSILHTKLALTLNPTLTLHP